MSQTTLSSRTVGTVARPEVRGKFLYVGREKLYVRGVTYGPFAPTAEGCEYHTPERVERDFSAMRSAGINSVRTYTVPPGWLMDLALKHGLWVMAGLPWEQHVAFLDDVRVSSAIVRRVTEMVRPILGHPALLAYTLGNEIPGPIVRWHGAARIESFLRRLCDTVRRLDPAGLITYVNYPTTEYLRLPFLDFQSFNVYLEDRDKLTKYLAKLQAHAGDQPVLMAELGLDSRRNGLQRQADTLVWQIQTAFEGGCCGLFVYAWSDLWHRGGRDVEDWDFGLVDRRGRAKPALDAVTDAFARTPFPADRDWPRISVVVCTYNGGRTIGDCAQGLRELRYPNFEVIVVDDGSKDNVGRLAESHGLRVVRKPNGGLSSARNVGMREASGQIVAYLDDDARPDPHWLHYLAHTFMTSDHAAVGGPNIPPAGDGPIAQCVANSPGGPIHVLLSDDTAEHIPGCNFAVRRDRLLAIDGFDERFRIAGDDVDLCWRLLENGWTIGFAHAAMVWHHRRNSIKAYLKQQLNYGRAEAMLERKWPGHYNAAGHVPWRGRIYGKGTLQSFNLSRPIIYHGVWGSAGFQSLYAPNLGLVSLLPQMPEWYLLIALFFVLTVVGVLWPPLLLAWVLLLVCVAAPLVQAALGGIRATFERDPSRPVSLGGRIDQRFVTALMHLLQPMMRFWGRTRSGLHVLRGRSDQRSAFPVPRRLRVWHERWASPEQRLSQLENGLEQARAVVRRGGDWDDWDLRISGGLLGSAKVSMAIEEHGGGRQQALYRVRPTWSPIGLGVVALLGVLTGLAGMDGSWIACGVLGGLFLLLGLKTLAQAAYAVGAAVSQVRAVAASQATADASRAVATVDEHPLPPSDDPAAAPSQGPAPDNPGASASASATAAASDAATVHAAAQPGAQA